MKIVVDENILYGKEAFSTCGEVKLLPGRKITNEELKDADVLIVRSVTNVGEELLKGTSVKFVGTATTGENHIDKEYLRQKGIAYSNADGCNAEAVAEYVLSAISYLAFKNNFSLKEKTIGIIGVGKIGSRVERFARALGMETLKNDPPLERERGTDEFVSLSQALSADVVTLHVPLNLGGEFNTYHLIDEEELRKLKPNSILINASRGEVVNNEALVRFLETARDVLTVIDVWENEPKINLSLLKKTTLSTPHVAGYSYEGKLNGTVMVYNALCKFLGISPAWAPPLVELENPQIKIEPNRSLEENLFSILQRVYPIDSDSNLMKSSILKNKEKREMIFDKLRKEYKVRRELSNYKLTGNTDERILKIVELAKEFGKV